MPAYTAYLLYRWYTTKNGATYSPKALEGMGIKNSTGQNKSYPFFLLFVVGGFYYMRTNGEAQPNKLSTYLDVNGQSSES